VDFCLGQADIHRVTGASRVKFLAWAGGLPPPAYVEKYKAPSALGKYTGDLVHPMICDLPIKTINRDMVVRVLQPIWHERQETARRVRMRHQPVIDYAIARKVFHGENPATLGD
jgi:hypothetical protein